ncbi:MAG: hypothetical protein JXA25_01170 [Anaerolineales bacterium]|nr:hypothetical protein [Anaerolineales bacterium]
MPHEKGQPRKRSWEDIGSEWITNIYEERKQRNVVSVETMGEWVGFKDKSRTNSMRNILKGRTQLKDEYIDLLAPRLAEIDPINLNSEQRLHSKFESDRVFTEAWIRSSLATYAGKQSPFLLTLPEGDRSDALKLLAQISALIEVSSRVSASLPVPMTRVILGELSNLCERWVNTIDALVQFQSMSSIGNQYEAKTSLVDFYQEMLDEALPEEPVANLSYAYKVAVTVPFLLKVGAGKSALQLVERGLHAIEMADTEVIWQLKYLLLVTKGNAVRTNAMDDESKFRKALETYHEAETCIYSDDWEEIALKIFNTYLLARYQPPADRIKEVQYIGTNSDNLEFRVKAFKSLGWLEASRRGERIRDAIKLRHQAINLIKDKAVSSELSHQLAICYQDVAEDYLHFGEFTKAEEAIKTALGILLFPHLGRIGYAHLIRGRVLGYQSLHSSSLDKEEVISTYLERSFSAFDTALDNFNRAREYSLGNSVYQEIQVKNERTKWHAFRGYLLRKINPVKARNEIELARSFLSNARGLVGPNNFYNFALLTNELIIWFYEILLSEDMRDFNPEISLEELLGRAEGLIQRIQIKENEHLPLPYDAERFSTTMNGHIARLSAIQAVAMEKSSGGTEDVSHLISQAFKLSDSYDVLSVLDSYLILSRVFSKEDLLKIAHTNLNPHFYSCLEKFTEK